MHRTLAFFVTWLAAGLIWAAPSPREAALIDLVSGNANRAVDRLQSAVRKAPEAERAALQCLLGRAQRLAGKAAQAEQTLAKVPASAACARRAAYDRADALLELGRADDAAAEYARLGAIELGPERDGDTVDWVLTLADRALGDEQDGMAAQLYDLALGAHIGPTRRRALAQRIATALTEQPERSLSVDRLGDALLERVVAQDTPADRRLLAAHLDTAAAHALLAAQAPDEATLKTMATVLEDAVALRLAALDALAKQGTAAGRDAADEAVLVRLKAKRLGAVDAAAIALADSKRPKAQAVSALRAALLAAGGDRAKARAIVEAHLARFPSDPSRAALTRTWRDLIRAQAREAAAKGQRAAAITHYAALADADPSDAVAAEAAVGSALVERAAGDLDAAEKRLRGAIARLRGTPHTQRPIEVLARLIAFDRNNLKGAEALLEELSGQAGADNEASRLGDTHLSIRTTQQRPGRDARIAVLTRNIESVDARLHAVDLEAYLRTGGAPSALPSLDVAVIAPDRRWSTRVPRFAKGKDVAFDLAVPKPKPGLYVVTVKARTEEASALLWVSRTRIAARMIGPDLAVAVFDDDKVAAGATVKVRGADGTVHTGETDRSGLFRLSLKAVQPVTILAEHRGAPAMLAVQHPSDTLPEPSVRLAVETDRPVYRPGDLAGVRIIARKGDAPVTGRFKLWLEAGHRIGETTVEASRFGTVTAELPIPPATFTDERQARSVALMVQAPGEDPQRLASLAIRPDGPAERTLDLFHDGPDAVALVREADGRPAAGVALELSAPGHPEAVELKTDATGRARLKGPPVQVAWQTRATIAGTDIRAKRARERPDEPALRLAVDDGPSGATPTAWLAGPDGRYRLTWSPVTAGYVAVKPPVDPWVPAEEEGLEGADGALADAPPAAVWFGAPTTREVTIQDGAAQVQLPALKAGRWQARAVRIGAPGDVEARFRIGDDRPGLSGVRAVRAGATLPVGYSGAHPALVVAGADRIRAAAVMQPGARVDWRTDGRWRDATVIAIDAAGRATREAAPVDPTAKVTLEASPQATPSWRITARVTDGAGKPVAAEVRLRIIDDRLVASGFAPIDGALDPIVTLSAYDTTAAVFGIVHAAAAQPISAALLAEARRAQEKKRARNAASGKFDSAFGELMGQAPLEAQGFGGLGTTGFGRGGGGLGRGRIGRKAKVRMGSVRSPFPRGERARVLWTVRTTDAQGVVQIDVPRPQTASRWTLDAVAIAAQTRGQAQAHLETHGDTRMHVVAPGAAGPGDQLLARVAVRHGGASTVAGKVVIGETAHPVSLKPGQGAVVEAGPFVAGADVPIRFDVGGALVEEQRWQIPVHAGEPAANGRVITVAAGPGGTPPTTWLALRGDGRWSDAGEAAHAGRAALAALPGAKGADRDALEARVAAAYHALSQLSPSGAEATAAVLHFLAEVRERFDVPRGTLEDVSKRIGNPGPDPAVRVAVLHARVAAGLEIDDSVVARLVRAKLTPEVASELAQVLIALKRKTDATPLVQGNGPHAVVARRRLGQKADPAPVLKTPPPRLGAPGLTAWIRATVTAPRGASGAAAVQLAGKTIGRIDRARGGAVVVVAEGTPTVDGLAAISWRSNPAPTGSKPGRVLRVPRTATGVASARRSGVWPKADAKPAEPVVLGIGDVLVLADMPPPGWAPPPGLARVAQTRLRAVTPGTMTLAGLKAGRDAVRSPVTIRIGADSPATGLDRESGLARAEHAVQIGADPTPWIAAWPNDGDWTNASRAARRAQVRFDHLMTQKSPDAGVLIDRFEALREARPNAGLPFEQVRRVAEAYRAKGVPKRAVAIWRAGLGGAFLAEAGLPRKVEGIGGLVASLEGLRRLAARYPGVPPVAKTTFLLPQRLDELAEQADLPEILTKAGVNRADLRLQAAGWDREFLALWPDAKERPQAAFHLVQTLQSLDAHAEAARWGKLLAAQHTDSAEYDGLVYLEGLSRLRLREDRRALSLFERLSTGEFPQADGSKGPAGTRDDARFALARLYEAKGDIKKAKKAYKAAASTHEDAADSAAALEEIRLTAQKLLRVKGSDAAKLPVRIANIDAVNLRAYRLDLRTVFLRDSGLDQVHAVKVSGVSPAWSGSVDVPKDPFPKRRRISLPLSKPGAYLVQIEGGGQQATSLVVRSDLSLDAGGGRVRVRVKGKPAAGIGVRTAGSGEVGVATTDVRGVAQVEGDAVLAFTDDGHVAFTEPTGWQAAQPKQRPRRPARRGKKKRKSNVKQRMQRQLEDNKRSYEQLLEFDSDESIQMNLL